MPIDAEAFRPDPVATVRGRIGCCGRLSDPRKNISLLLAAAEKLIDEGNDITVDLIGMGRNELERFFSVSPQLTNRLDVTPCLPRKDLARHLAKLDVYVVASHQEGLCIAALEAMACGCPVVSTRCGGPEEFVINDKTGFVVGFSATEMANRIGCIVGNRVLRERLSDAARTYVIGHYAPNLSRQVFWDHFEMAFAKSMRDQPIQKNAQNLRQHMQTRSG